MFLSQVLQQMVNRRKSVNEYSRVHIRSFVATSSQKRLASIKYRIGQNILCLYILAQQKIAEYQSRDYNILIYQSSLERLLSMQKGHSDRYVLGNDKMMYMTALYMSVSYAISSAV